MTEDDNSNPPSGRSTPELAVHRSSGAKLVFSTTKVSDSNAYANPPWGRSTPKLAVHRSSDAKLVFSTT